MPNNGSDSPNGDLWRTQPMYTVSEAAHLAGVSPKTIRRWLFGEVPDKRYPELKTPPVLGDREVSPYVSFLTLVEIVVAWDFRTVSRVRLDVVREAHSNLSKETRIEYPFAHIDLETLGGHIVRWIGSNGSSSAQAVDAPHQRSLPGLAERIRKSAEQRVNELDYKQKLASRWYPVGKNVPIVVDPLFSAGLPTIIDRGVTVDAIRRRWREDQKIEFIADDLQVDPDLIEQVLRYADKIAA